MANVVINPNVSGGNAIATNQVTRDSTTENIQLMNLADPTTANSANVSASGELYTATGGQNRTISTLSTATSASPMYVKATAGKVSKLINSSTSAQTVTITIIDQNSGGATAGAVVYSAILTAGQVVTLDIPCSTGIGIYASAAATGNIVLTWS